MDVRVGSVDPAATFAARAPVAAQSVARVYRCTNWGGSGSGSGEFEGEGDVKGGIVKANSNGRGRKDLGVF